MGTIQLKKWQFKGGNNPRSYGKWYAKVDHYSTVSTKELSRLAAEDSHVDPSEVEYIIGAIVKQIKELTLMGHTIEIPQIGTISVSADGSTADDYNDVRCDSLIREIRLNLRVNDSLRNELKHVTLRLK